MRRVATRRDDAGPVIAGIGVGAMTGMILSYSLSSEAWTPGGRADRWRAPTLLGAVLGGVLGAVAGGML